MTFFQRHTALAAFVISFMSLLVAGCDNDAPVGQKNEINTVVAFLRGADIQAETAEQLRELSKGLSDMLEKPTLELKNTRYADYQGTPNQWEISKLLTAYVVPTSSDGVTPPQGLVPDKFFVDVSKPAAHAVIREKKNSIEEMLRAYQATP